MGEIKFKAWSKKYKMIGNVVVLTNEGAFIEGLPRGKPIINKKSGIVSCPQSSGQFIKLKDLELMQYTGLDDRNGKEIFFGYIVKFYDWWQIPIHEIKKHDLCCNYAGYGGGIDYDCCEIVGNIYENPELIL